MHHSVSPLLFAVTISANSDHLKSIFESGGLDEAADVGDFLPTATDGKNYQTRDYNVKAVIRCRRPRPLGCLWPSRRQQRAALDAGQGRAHSPARHGSHVRSPAVIVHDLDVDVTFHRPDQAQSPLVPDAHPLTIALLTDPIKIKSDVPIQHINVDALLMALNQAKARDAR